MITDIAGVAVGHWTDEAGRTGCTVVLLPDGTVASGEVRGGAPGTREWEVLAPGRLVAGPDAVVLTGGSAFGLAACDGVARWCEEQGRGFATRTGPVPVVVGMVVYDLGVGDSKARPGQEEGYRAAAAARPAPFATGPVGAGCGSTVGSWRGPERATAGGLGTATRRLGGLVVSALVVVNAYGDVVPPGASADDIVPLEDLAAARPGGSLQQTTIGLVATNAALDKVGCMGLAQSAHDGLARALEPVHTGVDGDAVVAAATGEVEVDRPDLVRVMAARATEAAVLAAVPTIRR